jgi:isocitrate lyase
MSAWRSSFELGQHLLVADAAARIAVHHLDQLRDDRCTIADHVAGRAPRRRDQLAVDHQQAVVVAGQVGFHDHRARMLARGLVEAGADFLRR